MVKKKVSKGLDFAKKVGYNDIRNTKGVKKSGNQKEKANRQTTD